MPERGDGQTMLAKVLPREHSRPILAQDRVLLMRQAYLQITRYTKYTFLFLVVSWFIGAAIIYIVCLALTITDELGILPIGSRDVLDFFFNSQINLIAIPVVLGLPIMGVSARELYLDLVVNPKKHKQAFEQEWKNLSNEEKLLRHIEANMNPQAVAYLLKRADLAYQRESDGMTLAMAAVRYRGGNYQNTAWRMQALHGVCSGLPFSLRESTLNKQDKRGYTALMYAAEQSDDLGISLLITYGADIYVRNNDAKTASDLAQKWPSTVALIENRNGLERLLSALHGQGVFVSDDSRE
jgi:Ankyrin repeat